MTDEREGMVSSAELCRCALARLGFEAQAAQRPEYEVAENADADHLATRRSVAVGRSQPASCLSVCLSVPLAVAVEDQEKHTGVDPALTLPVTLNVIKRQKSQSTHPPAGCNFLRLVRRPQTEA